MFTFRSFPEFDYHMIEVNFINKKKIAKNCGCRSCQLLHSLVEVDREGGETINTFQICQSRPKIWNIYLENNQYSS